MSSPCRFSVIVVALVCAGSSIAAAQVNPDYTSWAQYGLGTSVVTKQISKWPGNTSEVSITRTLIEKTEEKIVIEMTMRTNSTAPQLAPSRIEIKSQMQPQRGRGSPRPSEEIKESQEAMTVGGRSFQAKVVETTRKESGQTVINKVWTSPQFPGLTLKSIQRIEGGQNTETIIEATDATIKPAT